MSAPAVTESPGRTPGSHRLEGPMIAKRVRSLYAGQPDSLTLIAESVDDRALLTLLLASGGRVVASTSGPGMGVSSVDVAIEAKHGCRGVQVVRREEGSNNG